MLYIVPPLTTEPGDLSDEAFAFIEARVPGWLPSEGNLETWLIEAMSNQSAEIADVASAVPASIFRYFGSSVLGLPPFDSTAATAQTTWTMVNGAGYTIPSGTLVGVEATGSELVPFQTIGDVIVPVGTTVAAIVCEAVDAGTDANALTGDVQLIDPLTFVNTVALAAATAGGVDAETDDEYLDRLRELTTILAPRPILPGDFAILAKTDPRVFRATAVDLHQAGTPELPKVGVIAGQPVTPIPGASADGVARCVTVAVAGETGLSIGDAARQDVANMLESAREVNFYVYVVDPTYTNITVAFSVRVYADHDAATVVAAVIAAIQSYLSPATFGAPPYGDQTTWVNDTKVRYLEVAQIINNTPGVNYIISLTINGGTADVALTGTAPLPRTLAGAVTGTAA
jgi:uncharacterized phage protein gp47/JayE